MSPQIRSASQADSLKDALEQIHSGEPVAVPTETVYGLAADARSDRAVSRIYEIKKRPSFNPLIVHVADLDAATRLVELDDIAIRLADAFWPGPLTLVARLKAGHGISPILLAGHETLAVRVPDAPVMQTLISRSGRPLAAPSANASGSISPTTALHVQSSLTDWNGIILDNGPCRVGLESTIVDVTTDTPAILRQGGLPEEALTDLVGDLDQGSRSSSPKAPGQLSSHYAPKARLRLNVTCPDRDEAWLTFGPTRKLHCIRVVSLSPDGDLTEAASNLFAALHELDTQYSKIAVAPVPDQGIGRAINDRLLRAAHGKS